MRTLRLFCSCLLVVGLESFAFSVNPPDIGTRLEPFMDPYLIEGMDGVQLRVNSPRAEGVVLKFDQAWEGAFCGYCTVIHDDGRYRLYYRGLPDAGADGSPLEVTCYAESEDGINWIKPKLGLFQVRGSRDNNVILAELAPFTHNFSPFLDAKPTADPKHRFKAMGGVSKSGLKAFSSPDGIHWSAMSEGSAYRQEGWVFDSQNVSFWSESEKQYVLYYRSSVDGIRAIARAVSSDFIHWTKEGQMRYSDSKSTVPSQHLYTNQTRPYFRAEHIYISTAARFMPGRKVLTDEQARAVGVHPKYFNDTSDSVLMTSRGGLDYDRTFLGALIKPGIGAENWVSRSNYPALGIVPTGKYEMSMYVNQDYGQPTSHLRRYSIRLDGLSCVAAPFAGGELLTRPFRMNGNQLWLNFSTSAAGGVRVEIQDHDQKPLSGYRMEDSMELIGNEIRRLVQWKSNSETKSLKGKLIRLKFHLSDAELFSFQFASPLP